MTDMGDIGTFDAVYCSHALEHLHPYDVPVALGEFLRVLNPNGFVLVLVPDLEDVKPTTETLYVAACGPVTGRDLYYGHAGMSASHPYMAHRTGFVSDTLRDEFTNAGFSQVVVERKPEHNLLAIAAR